jgi:hypothetical protein
MNEETNGGEVVDQVIDIAESSLVSDVIAQTFGGGLETFDRMTREPQNLGGAKLWGVRNWKDPLKQQGNSRVMFYMPELQEMMKCVMAQVFTVSKAMKDEDGELIPVERLSGSAGHKRAQCGFMLYLTVQTKKSCQAWLERFQEILGADKVDTLANYAQNLVTCGTARVRGGVFVLNGVSTTVQQMSLPMDLNACIYFALPSGAEADGAVWGFVGKDNAPVQDDASGSHPPV